MQWDAPNDYVMQFNPNFRGIIGHLFCDAVRQGCDDVQAVLDWVEQDCMHRENPVYREVVNTLYDGEAWDFAQHMLDRESLSPEEKIRLKKESTANNDFARNAMQHATPTSKQLAYLKSLGCTTIPKSKLEASDLIEKYVNSREIPKVVGYDKISF